MCKQASQQSGLTLVELVISIVILSIVVVGVFSALGTLVGRSADPMIRQQSIAVAQAYLEEIQSMDFGLPGGGCPAVPGTGGRANFNNICHYHNLSDSGAVDQNGSSIASLANYDVTVTVTGSSNLGSLSAASAARIDVSVTGPTNETVIMSGYRTNY